MGQVNDWSEKWAMVGGNATIRDPVVPNGMDIHETKNASVSVRLGGTLSRGLTISDSARSSCQVR